MGIQFLSALKLVLKIVSQNHFQLLTLFTIVESSSPSAVNSLVGTPADIETLLLALNEFSDVIGPEKHRALKPFALSADPRLSAAINIYRQNRLDGDFLGTLDALLLVK